MNLYIRYFDEEAVVATVTDAYNFLSNVVGEQLSSKHLQQLQEYHDSDITFTKRFKVRPRVYFVAIKTDAETIEQFKERGRQIAEEKAAKSEYSEQPTAQAREEVMQAAGWYEGSITFKRVLLNEKTGKNEYIDTDFSARVKATSAADLYAKMCNYLLSRDDVDSRSQMPSIKGRRFRYSYLGESI